MLWLAIVNCVADHFLFCYANSERRKPKDWLTDKHVLRIVYDSEVCTENYGQPHSAFLLLHYIPSARTFLSCKKVTDKDAAQQKLENQPSSHHDIRHMTSFSLRGLLPPRPSSRGPIMGASVPIEEPSRKRKAPTRESPSPLGSLEGGYSFSSQSPLGGPVPPSRLRMTLLGNVLAYQNGQSILGLSKASTTTIWAPSFEVFGEAVRSNTAILPVGDGHGTVVANSLCQVARLPLDMDECKRSCHNPIFTLGIFSGVGTQNEA